MNPSSSILNVANSLLCNAESLRHSTLISPFHGLKKFNNLFHFLKIKLSSVLAFAYYKSSFSQCVLSIIRMCSQKQVAWVYARPHIARMANKHSIVDGSEEKYPRCSMRPKRPVITTASSNLTVSSFVYGSSPQPTGWSFSDLGKESFWKRRRKSLRLQIFRSNFDQGHNKFSLFCSAPGRVNGSGAIRFHPRFSRFTCQGGLVE